MASCVQIRTVREETASVRENCFQMALVAECRQLEQCRKEIEVDL